jgi:hypothetical protein
MKNIHILSTNKLSILGFDSVKNLHFTNDFIDDYQHIYITSDEEITANVYALINGVLCKTEIKEGKIVSRQLSGGATMDICKTEYLEIILTTDTKLIADGIQPIPDDFLEWFIKNPSCERVEVKKGFADGSAYGYDFLSYKIIIPKEEPKQGTMSEAIKQVINNQLKQEPLEEVAKNNAVDNWLCGYNHLKLSDFDKNSIAVDFGNGWDMAIKWQQEQSNCELTQLLEQRNEMLAMLEELYEDVECWSDISSYGYGNKIEQLIKEVKDNG